jgi:hypothetical protein
MTTKKCSVCGITKENTKGPTGNFQRDGHGGTRAACKDCTRSMDNQKTRSG